MAELVVDVDENPGRLSLQTPPNVPAVAIVPWGDWIEDYLDGIGLSLDQFCEDVAGGWLFGYVDALQRAGMRPFLAVVSRNVARPVRRTHRPSGAAIWFLPSPGTYRRLRRVVSDPYSPNASAATAGLSVAGRLLGRIARHIAPYVAFPLRAFDAILKREGCRIVIAQEYEYARFDVLSALALGRGLSLFATYQGGAWKVSALERMLRPITLRACDGLVVASSAEARRLGERYGLGAESVHRVFNPLDVDAWRMPDRMEARAALDIPDDARVAAWHGRISFRPKGIDVLLAAWRLLQEDGRRRDQRLMLIGSGSDGHLLHRELEDPRLAGVYWRDEFVVDKSIIRQVLAAADVYVFPSRHEGFPVALIEAMASGLPLVATDAPGVREILGVDDGEEVGIQVPAGDARALADGLSYLFDNPARARELGRNARTRAETDFRPAVVGAKLRNILLDEE